MPSLRKSVLRVTVVAGLVGILGCETPTGAEVCTLGARFAVSVRIRDAISGQPIAAGATLIVRDGEFADTVSVPSDAAYYNDLPLGTPKSVERPGTYAVSVRRPGYESWERTDVVVRDGQCGIAPAQLTARLQPR